MGDRSSSRLGTTMDLHLDARDARRYRRLQVLGAIVPYLQEQFRDLIGVKYFTNLDKIVDDDLERFASRGEARPMPSTTPDPNRGMIVLERPPVVLIFNPPVPALSAILLLHEEFGPQQYKVVLQLGGGLQHGFGALSEAEYLAILARLGLPADLPLPQPSQKMIAAWERARLGASAAADENEAQ